jgi:hypothetical protein
MASQWRVKIQVYEHQKETVVILFDEVIDTIGTIAVSVFVE